MVSTFGLDGPTTCSGLPIVRYPHQELVAESPGHRLLSTSGKDHETRWGTTQQVPVVPLQREV